MDNSWLYWPAFRKNAWMRLFCFPYAGGSPTMFRSWLNRLPESIEIVAVRLPGRDARIKEPAFSEWSALLNAMELALAPYFDNRFAFFGHSLGASLAYELAQRLHNQEKIPLTQLLISGCQCPHLRRRKPPMHHLPRQEFLERLREMNGTPSEVLKDKVLMALLEPTLRADIKLAETWEGTTRQPLNVPITAFSGLMDDVAPPPDMQDWKRYTNAEFSFYTLPGNHFFVHTSEEMLLRTISSICSSI
ncbi:hypothetical protein NIES2130_23405 [Scytonema sp. HK-05]|nr:hypothetical protein NIES2130_23405 [Scytonema sp. HK-05]